MTIFRPVVKTFGGKSYNYKWIISLFPQDYEKLIFVEPFVGGGSVFLNKNISRKEIINDRNPELIAIYRALQSDPAGFISELQQIPYSEESFIKASYGCYSSSAINEYVLHRMSRGGMCKTFSISTRLRGGQEEGKNAWETAIAQLPKIADRLHNVDVYNVDGIDLIKQISGYYNVSDVLMYLDPPYLPSLRVSTNVYKYEMTEAEHIKLAQILQSFKGKFLISGYNCPLYSNELYKHCHLYTHNVANSAGQNKKKFRRTECLWTNF